MSQPPITPTREDALRRLTDFLPRAGRDYAARRNFDLPGHPHVSGLSPHIRHRLICEQEVLRATLGRHALSTAEKFVQEVFWRSYWKGWLELRPGVWDAYRAELHQTLNRVQTESGLRAQWEAACNGETGLDAFDHWAAELTATGYLHNHARMWFASIWIFTLRLPWVLGADFFLRHLLDGDAASNTLGWRWVAGLQTPGKNYLARASNIARYTEGRFDLRGKLDETAAPLEGPPPPWRQAPPQGEIPDRSLRTGLLVTDDDLSPGHAMGFVAPAAAAVVTGTAARSPLTVSPAVTAFAEGAVRDMAARHGGVLADADRPPAGDLAAWARDHRLEQVVMPFVPVGPARDLLAAPLADLRRAGVRVAPVIRPFDATCWPHATAGFFKFKKHIPEFIATLGLGADPGGRV